MQNVQFLETNHMELCGTMHACAMAKASPSVTKPRKDKQCLPLSERAFFQDETFAAAATVTAQSQQKKKKITFFLFSVFIALGGKQADRQTSQHSRQLLAIKRDLRLLIRNLHKEKTEIYQKSNSFIIFLYFLFFCSQKPRKNASFVYLKFMVKRYD